MYTLIYIPSSHQSAKRCAFNANVRRLRTRLLVRFHEGVRHRHETLRNKMATLELYLTTYTTGSRISSVIDVAALCSSDADVTASVIQSSGIRLESHIVTSADLHPFTTGNRIVADDTFLVVPASNSNSQLEKISRYRRL